MRLIQKLCQALCLFDVGTLLYLPDIRTMVVVSVCIKKILDKLEVFIIFTEI